MFSTEGDSDHQIHQYWVEHHPAEEGSLSNHRLFYFGTEMLEMDGLQKHGLKIMWKEASCINNVCSLTHM